ncbi:MAG: toprim domain-containing protein [bacterium]
MINVNELKKLEPETVLLKLGLQSKKIGNNIFTSIRNEKTPSVSIHNVNGQWLFKDFGDNDKGGSWIDLAMKVLGCDYVTAIKLLSGNNNFSFSRPNLSRFTRKEAATKEKSSITLNSVSDVISDKNLIDYLCSRKILNIPSWLLQISYTVITKKDDKTHTYQNLAIGVKNNKGGYAVRNNNFKGNIGLTAYSLISNYCNKCGVLEGMFDTLSYMQLAKFKTDIICLNSTKNLNSEVLNILQQYRTVYICLDNDETGKSTTKTIKSYLTKTKAVNISNRYIGYKDLNEYLIGS